MLRKYEFLGPDATSWTKEVVESAGVAGELVPEEKINKGVLWGYLPKNKSAFPSFKYGGVLTADLASASRERVIEYMAAYLASSDTAVIILEDNNRKRGQLGTRPLPPHCFCNDHVCYLLRAADHKNRQVLGQAVRMTSRYPFLGIMSNSTVGEITPGKDLSKRELGRVVADFQHLLIGVFDEETVMIFTPRADRS
jgi:hypothetical protein